MWAETYTIDGFEFILIGTNGEDGVVIPPNADLDNPAYFAALKKAQQLYPYVDVANRIGEYARAYNIDRLGYLTYVDQPIDDDMLDDIIEMGEMLISQNKIDVPQYIKNYIEIAKEDKQRRAERDQKKKEKRAKQLEPKPGYVYLIQSPTGNYKIGRTTDPANRLKTFEVKLPFEVEFVCVIQCENMFTVERELHQRFADKRVNGEWFSLLPDDVEYIKGLVK